MSTTLQRWICGRRQSAAAAKRRAGAGCAYRRLSVEQVEDRVLLSSAFCPDLGQAICNAVVGPRIERWGAEPAIEQVDFASAAASFHYAASSARRVTEPANGRPGFELTTDRLLSEPAARRFDSEMAGTQPLAGSTNHQADIQSPIDRSASEPAARRLDADAAGLASPGGLGGVRLDGGLSVDLFKTELTHDRVDAQIPAERLPAALVSGQADIHSPSDRFGLELVAGRFHADAARPELPAGWADELSDGESPVDFFGTGSTGDRFDPPMPYERPAAREAGAPFNGESPTDGLEAWPAIEHFGGQISDGQFAAAPTDDGFPRPAATGGFAIDVAEDRIDPKMPDGPVLAGLASDQLQSASPMGSTDRNLAALDFHQIADLQGPSPAVTAFRGQTTSTPIDRAAPVTQVAANEGGFIDIPGSFSGKGLLMSLDAVGRNPLTPSPEEEFSRTDLGRTHTASITRGEAAADAGSADAAPSTSRITPLGDGVAARERTEYSGRVEGTDGEMLSSDPEEGSASESHWTAIAPADLTSEESEGGLIDLTCVVNKPVRFAGKKAEAEGTPPGLVDGEQPDRATAEELAVDGSRGRSQVFELAMAVGHGDGTDEVRRCVDQAAPIVIPEATPPFLPLPEAASGGQASPEEAAFGGSRAYEVIFAEIAEEPGRALTPPANDENPWSASLMPLFGPVVLSFGIAERTVHSRREKRRTATGFPS